MQSSSVHLQKCRSCKKLNVLDQPNLIRFFVTTTSKLVGISRLINTPVVINSSGMPIRAHRNCPHLKNGHWYALDLAMTGDAPKDFLSVYEYGAPGCKRGRRKSWPRLRCWTPFSAVIRQRKRISTSWQVSTLNL
jgi:hypothetical protein